MTISVSHWTVASFATFSSLAELYYYFSMLAQVGVHTSHMRMFPTNSKLHSWETYGEDISSLGASGTMTAGGLLEQINITRDSSDYLWYMTR